MQKHLSILLSAAWASVHATAGAARVATQKGDEFVGHHAIVTPADIAAQYAALTTIDQACKEDYQCICEENLEGLDPRIAERVLRRPFDPRVVERSERLYIIDALDGSSMFQRGLYERSTSIGLHRRARPYGGVIIAPDVFSGLTVFGTQEDGVRWSDGMNAPREANVSTTQSLPDAIVLSGPDMMLDSWSSDYFHRVAREARTVNVVGSCALGMALVAIGRADAIVQPPHRVWDYGAGWPLIELAGGTVRFYERNHGRIACIERFAPADYDPSDRRLGFIAGGTGIVGQLETMLLESGHTSDC